MVKIKQDGYKNFVENMIILSRNITIMASLLLIFVLLGSTFYLYRQSPSILSHSQASTTDFGHELEASFIHENTQKEWKWLYKYHGNPTVVIYEERQTPYFFDKQGRKCAFTYPSKRIGQMNDRMDDSKNYAELKLNNGALNE